MMYIIKSFSDLQKLLVGLDSKVRLYISLGVSAILFILSLKNVVPSGHWMLTWLGFCITHLLFSWLTIATCAPEQIRRTARKQDTGRAVISVFMLIAACASLVALAILISPIKNLGDGRQTVHVVLAIASVFCAWMLIHTNFVFRYAHLYYSERKGDQDTTGGLDFPGDEEPDYLDFTYFTYVIGTTFQVADVAISSKKIRRVVCLHGVMSFVFNTVILALSINLISGIVQK
jgi:uncharacterized membrane protein